MTYHMNTNNDAFQKNNTTTSTIGMISTNNRNAAVSPMTALQLWKRIQFHRKEQTINQQQQQVQRQSNDGSNGTGNDVTSASTSTSTSTSADVNTAEMMPMAPIIPLLLQPKVQPRQRQTSSSGSDGINHDNNKTMDWLLLGTQANTGTITELAGKAGTGKTQLCLSICLSTVMLRVRVPVFIHGMCSNKRRFAQDHEKTNNGIGIGNGNHLKRRMNDTNENGNTNVHLNPYSNPNRALPTATATATATNTTNQNEDVYNNANEYTYKEALYISMNESGSSSQIAHRIHQMASTRLQRQQGHAATSLTSLHVPVPVPVPSKQQKQGVQQIMQRIHTRFLHNPEEFMDLLDSLPFILEHGIGAKATSKSPSKSLPSTSSTKSSSIGLIVLDSIAGLYRTPEEKEGVSGNYYINRSQGFFDIASRLKDVAGRFGVNVLVVNQVTDVGSSRSVPSLGLSWSCCVNDRYCLSRKEVVLNGNGNESGGGDLGGTRFVRRIEMMASSRWMEGMSTEFRVEDVGTVLV